VSLKQRKAINSCKKTLNGDHGSELGLISEYSSQPTGWPLSSPRQIPQLFQDFPWRHYYLLNHQRYIDRPTCIPERKLLHGYICGPSFVSQIYLTVLGYVYFVTIATAVAQHRQTCD